MISVAIPAYKPQFLLQAIESVLSQTFSDIELIIINDCSPHNLDKIVEKVNDKRIRYYSNPINLGQVSLVNAWNKCLEYARGEYFVLFSDDDIYHPDFLLKLYELTLKYPDSHVFHCRVKKIDENNNILGFTPTCPEFENVLDYIWHTVKGYRNQFAPDFMSKTASLKDIGGFYELPLAWGSDYITWFRLAAIGGIAYTQDVLCYWRSSGTNLSSIGSFEKRVNALEGYFEWLVRFLSEYEPNGAQENEIREQCLSSLNKFFINKHRFLFQQEISKKSFAQKLVKAYSYSKISPILRKDLIPCLLKSMV